LLPPNLNDWLGEGHLALFISDTVDILDLGEIFADYDNETDRGNPAYHPVMMLKILLYGYCVGMMSSRKIQKACWDDVAFRVLSADQHPEHHSISRFRKRHLKSIGKLFLQVLKLAQKAGLVKLGLVAIDGTKMKANASKHKAMSYERMVENEKRLKKEIEELLLKAQSVDTDEDSRYGQDKLGDELPNELSRRESRLATIQNAMNELEKEAKLLAQSQEKERIKKEREQKKKGKPPKGGSGASGISSNENSITATPSPKTQRNFTDPDSRIMWNTNSKSFEQSYNAQAAVDSEAQIIVAVNLTQEANDKKQLHPMIRKIRQNTKAEPDFVLADTGYCSETNLTDKSLGDIQLLIPPDRDAHGKASPAQPIGRIPKNISAINRMRRKLKTVEGRALYKRRKAIVEPVFGQIKHARAIRQFLLRGIENVRHEWELICLSHNIKKLFTKGWSPQMA
jgi:transposase